MSMCNIIYVTYSLILYEFKFINYIANGNENVLILFWEAGCFTDQVFFLCEGHHSDQVLLLWQEKTNNNKPTKETNEFLKNLTTIKITIM